MSDKFYKLPQSLTPRKDLLASDKLVFAVIADRIGKNGYCWPGVRTLAKETGLAVSTVVESIDRLDAAGDIEVERRGNGKTSHYRIGNSAPETTTVKKPKRTEKPNGQEAEAHQKPNTGAPKTRTEAYRKSEPNQTDKLNQTTTSSNFSFVLRTGDLWYLPPDKLREYHQTFNSGLDIEAELHKAAQWLRDNPERRKTDRGMFRFINGWLSRVKPKQLTTVTSPLVVDKDGLTPREKMIKQTEAII